MRFKKFTTFNTHDTQVEKGENGRIQINQKRGVKARCELAIYSVLRFSKNGGKGCTAEMVTDDLNSRLSANYSTTDIRYALTRLANEDVIKVTNHGQREHSVFRATPAALNHWRRMPKE